jgi:hypothetical protein
MEIWDWGSEAWGRGCRRGTWMGTWIWGRIEEQRKEIWRKGYMIGEGNTRKGVRIIRKGNVVKWARDIGMGEGNVTGWERGKGG